MDVISKGLHPIRKPLRVWNRVPIFCAFKQVPAVIQVHIFIAQFIQTEADDRIDRVFDKLLTNVAAELVPSVPPHLRCPS